MSKKYFGHSSHKWEQAMMAGAGTGQQKAMRDAVDNPQNYTTAMPNGSSEAAFKVGSTVGAGKDGMRKGPDTVYYKVERSKAKASAPTSSQQAPAQTAVPKEQSQKIEPVKQSSVIQDAKSRVQEYQKQDYSSIFQQNDTDFTSQYQPSSSPDLPEGMERKDPQEFANKYKLDLNDSGTFN